MTYFQNDLDPRHVNPKNLIKRNEEATGPVGMAPLLKLVLISNLQCFCSIHGETKDENCLNLSSLYLKIMMDANDGSNNCV